MPRLIWWRAAVYVNVLVTRKDGKKLAVYACELQARARPLLMQLRGVIYRMPIGVASRIVSDYLVLVCTTKECDLSFGDATINQTNIPLPFTVRTPRPTRQEGRVGLRLH